MYINRNFKFFDKPQDNPMLKKTVGAMSRADAKSFVCDFDRKGGVKYMISVKSHNMRCKTNRGLKSVRRERLSKNIIMIRVS